MQMLIFKIQKLSSERFYGFQKAALALTVVRKLHVIMKNCSGSRQWHVHPWRVFPQSNKNRLNMELDLLSLFGLHVHSCTHRLRPRIPPPRIYEGAIGQPR
jgi:hypothetical protein